MVIVLTCVWDLLSVLFVLVWKVAAFYVGDVAPDCFSHDITVEDRKYMRAAIELANESVERGGGPFGAVIVKDGEIVAGSSNSVTLDNYPTAHAEVKPT